MAEQPKARDNDAGTHHHETDATPDQPATNEPRAESTGPAASASSDHGPQEPLPSSSRPPDVSPPTGPGAPWGEALQRFFDGWTRVETYLCVVVVIAEILAMVAWVILKGLGTPRSAGTPTGTIVRAVIGATMLGLVAYFATRKQALWVRRVSNTLAMVAGLSTGGLWASVGVAYFANILNWLQDASSLTLIGGLRGLGTRLTIWLAMLGGSLAAASGKHIHIDVVMRFVPRKARLGATLVTWVGAAAVCFVAAWGFVDHIAIESYDAGRDAPAGEKIATIGRHTSEGFFILRKQLALDLSTLPHVLAGNQYDRWLTNEEWNRRVEGAGWDSHFTPDQVATLKMPPDVASDYRLPVVMVPGSTHQGLLKHLLNLVFPFGFLIIGLRFLLRGVLALSGHVSVDPDAPHASVESHRDQEGAA